MATRRYSLAKGKGEFDVVEAVGAATATADLEITLDLAVNGAADMAGLIDRIEHIKNWIIKGNKPPA